MKLGFKKVHPNAVLPKYAHVGDAGMDVCSIEDVILIPGEPVIVKTGLVAEIPAGYELQVRPRSGLATKGVTVWNSPGTIDSNYRGEIGVILCASAGKSLLDAGWNYYIKSGDRIAQLVLAPVTKADIVEVTEVSETDRGEGGFGSTGV